MASDPVLVAVLGASAVICFVMGLWLPAVDGERRIARRLRGFVQAPLAVVDAQIGLARSRPPRGTQSVAKRNLIVRYVERRIADADSAMMPAQLLTGSAALAVAAFILAMRAFGDPLPGVPAAAAGAALPLKWLGWRQGRKISRFTRQLPGTGRLGGWEHPSLRVARYSWLRFGEGQSNSRITRFAPTNAR